LINEEMMRRDPTGPDARGLKKAVFSLTANGQKIQPNATRLPAMACIGTYAVGALIFRPRTPVIDPAALIASLPESTINSTPAAAAFCVSSCQVYALFTFIPQRLCNASI